MTNALHFDYPWWKAKNRWHSIDAHFDHEAGSVTLSLFPVNVANRLILYRNDQIAFEIPDLHDPNSLTLCWPAFSDWARERVALAFAYTARQYRIYEWPQPIATQFTNDAGPKICEARLTLILPWGYPKYVMIEFGIVYHWWCFDSLCTVFMYFLLHHYIVL